MKNLKNMLFISSLIIGLSFSADDEEEVRTIEKDGTLYKINNTSLHITPYTEQEEDNAISKEADALDGASEIVEAEGDKKKGCLADCIKSCCAKCNLTISMGTVMDFDSVYDPGMSLGILVPTPWAFDLFGKNWKVSGELYLSNLTETDTGVEVNINSGIAHFTPSFELPVNIDFGLGIGHIKNKGGICGTGTLDVNYALPIEKADISLGFRYQKFVDVSKEDPYLDFSFLDVYGFNLNYSKGF